MAISLKPSEELLMAITGVAIVLAEFQVTCPPLADVRADQKGNVNSYKSVNQAVITSAAILGSVSLIARTPTVFTIGGAVILLKAWQHHFANYGADGTKENAMSQAYAAS